MARERRLTALLGSALIAIAAIPMMSAPAEAATVPPFAHVFVIVMENHSYSEIIGSSQAPYTNQLAAGNALATNYYAAAHPSLPNYLVLSGGSTYGISSDCTTCWVSATNLGDSLETAGKTWKAYEESMPSPCYVGDSYPYVQKHDPFVYFNDIRTNTTRCQAHVVPYTQLSTDLQSAATTPSFGFITPNACNDMHDCSIATGDAWLQHQVPAIINSPAFTTQKSVLFITWDEDDFTVANHVPLIAISSAITQGARSSLGYNHYSLLSTVEAALGAAPINSVIAGAPPMADLLQPPPAALCTAPTLTTSPATPGATGVAVTMTAASAGCANPRYRFWVRDPGSRWSIVQDYSSSNTHVWAQAFEPGTFALEVDVRDASETSAYDAVANLAYVARGCTAASLTATPGASVALNGLATCPSTPAYRFWVRAPGAAWKIVRDYSSSSTYAWSPSLPGTYGLEVDVRDQGALDLYEAVSNLSYTAG